MGRYREDYMLTHDIDYFFRVDRMVFHIASNGGLLPGFIDRQYNYLAQTYIYRLPSIFDTYLADSEMLRVIFNNRELDCEKYCRSFKLIASKGIVSMDRINALNPSDNSLIIVASPHSSPNGSDTINDIIPLIPNIQDRIPPEIENVFQDLFSSASYGTGLGKIIEGELLFKVDYYLSNYYYNVNR